MITGIAALSYTILLYIYQNDMGGTLHSGYILPGLAMGKIYSNTMLGLLNSRAIIKGGRRGGYTFESSEVWSSGLQEHLASIEEHAMNTIRARSNRPEDHTSRLSLEE
jgi:hypothetical protein